MSTLTSVWHTASLRTLSLLTIIGGALLVALFSQITLPLWFTPVPLSLQSGALLWVGALLGHKKGTAALLSYLGMGAIGLPVFAGGVSGVALFFGPRGGYLMGFLVAAFLVGWLREKGMRGSFCKELLAVGTGGMALLACGALWLSCLIGWQQAFCLGVVPFLLGDLLKIVVVASLLSIKRKSVDQTAG